MVILGRNKIYLRFVGAFCILAGLMLSITFSIVLLLTVYLFFLLVVGPMIILSSCIKIEIKIVNNNLKAFLIIILVFSLLMTIIGIILIKKFSIGLSFIVFLISNILAIICWHYSLTLYRKKKNLFIISGLGSITLSILYCLFKFKWCQLLGILPSALMFCGMLMILITELVMKKRGLLNYL
ncbi:MAG: hypothetical protein ACFFCI_06045 [Promethearchaeota archaeon]